MIFQFKMYKSSQCTNRKRTVKELRFYIAASCAIKSSGAIK